jgi:hypothetical protein
MVPANPTMPADPFYNPLTPTMDQMTFVYTHYPEYALNPVDLLVWLYQTALYNEEQARRMKMALEGFGTTDPYSQPPKNKLSKVKGGKKGGKQDDDEDMDEDSTYLNMRDLRKKKP